MHRELYIIRHGQTDHNVNGIVQGRGVNLPLNSEGQRQALAFFEAYKHVPFDVVYTSSLKRTKQTAEPFKKLGILTRHVADLDEISWGNWEGAVSTEQTRRMFKKLLQRWKKGDIHAKASPGAESPFELQQRQLKFIRHLDKAAGQKILIATHGRYLRALLCTLTGKPLKEMENFDHTNLCLYKLARSANGAWEIEQSCVTKHLKEIMRK